MATLCELLVPYPAISLIGMAKNTGKTTVLNHLIASFAERETSLGITSLGLDGEAIDAETGTAKPRVFAPEGLIVATATGLLSSCEISKEIIATTGIPTALGEVVVFRALSAGYVQIAGPSLRSQVSELSAIMSNLGVTKLLIDGALNRRAIACPQVSKATVLCTGAALHRDLQRVISETAFAVKLLGTSEIDAEVAAQIAAIDDSDQGDYLIYRKRTPVAFTLGDAFEEPSELMAIYLQGALTDATAAALLSYSTKLPALQLICDDSSKLFISEPIWQRLHRRDWELRVVNPINLVAVTINPSSPKGFSFEPQLFLETMRERIDLPVYDIVRGGGALVVS